MSDTKNFDSLGFVKIIQSDRAHDHWIKVLDQVGSGQSFIVNDRHQEAVAVLVPVQEWNDLHERNDENSPESLELDALVETLNRQNQRTSHALDEAFSELAKMRADLAAMRMDREQGMEQA